jgi:transposase
MPDEYSSAFRKFDSAGEAVLIIGTSERFHCGKQIGTYVGMIPGEDSSGGRQRLEHISKQGNALLRFLLVEVAQAAVRIHPDWRRRYIHLAMRKCKSIAKVAMGRKLGVRLYWMWRNNCEYSPSFEFGSYVGRRVSTSLRPVFMEFSEYFHLS